MRVDVDPNEPLEFPSSLCIAVGGVLRINGTGPGTVTADPEDLVAQDYEAGVVDVQFLRSGTVVVTVARDSGGPKKTTVVVR